uniref:Uncharacterized protein n=1 Tax=Arundo donax TaxID=35708 RepID=A0A0A8YPB6_ARUDO
MPPTRRSGAG